MLLQYSSLLPVAALAFLCLEAVRAVPMPRPIVNRPSSVKRAQPTPAPMLMRFSSQPDAIHEFYRPKQVKVQSESSLVHQKAQQGTQKQWAASPTQKRQDYPTFPAQYPSCYNCQQNYPSLSSCMEASSVFENATDIFNSPMSYISVLKCACTDTFQAVYPQCVECFQLTNQCEYLGTDAAGTGAPQIVTNMRNICAFASSIFGKAQSANYPDYNFTYTPSVVPTYTDVTSTGPGYIDEATGAIFSGALPISTSISMTYPALLCAAFTVAFLLTL